MTLNNEGLEFLARRFPIPIAGLARGAAIRVIKVVVWLKTLVLKVGFPLPLVLWFGEDPASDQSLSSHPLTVIPDSHAEANRGDSLRSRGPRNRITFLYRAVLAQISGQPVVGYFKILGTPEPSTIANFEEKFLREIHRNPRFFLSRRAKKAIVVVSDSEPKHMCEPERHHHRTASGTYVLQATAVRESESKTAANDRKFGYGGKMTGLVAADEVSRAALLATPRARPALVFCPSNVIGDQWYFGLGDVLLGAALVHQTARKLGRVAFIDWSAFSGAHIFSPEEPGPYMHGEAHIHRVSRQINSDVPIDVALARRVFTNRRPIGQIGSDTKEFLRSCLLTESKTARDSANSFLANVGLDRGGYRSVHVRFGDSRHQKPEATTRLLSHLNGLFDGEVPLVLFSDKPELLPDVSTNQSVHVRVHAGVHSAMSSDTRNIEDALTDLLLMGQSSRIVSLSRYAWGSGFALAASIIYDVPLFQKVAFQKVWDMPEFSRGAFQR